MRHHHRHVSRYLPRPSKYSPASLFYRLPLLCLCGGGGQDSVLFLVSELLKKKKSVYLWPETTSCKKKQQPCIEFFFFGTKKNTHIYIKINQRCVGGLLLYQRERAGVVVFFRPCEFKSAQTSVATDERCALSWHRGILMMDSSFVFPPGGMM